MISVTNRRYRISLWCLITAVILVATCSLGCILVVVISPPPPDPGPKGLEYLARAILWAFGGLIIAACISLISLGYGTACARERKRVLFWVVPLWLAVAFGLITGLVQLILQLDEKLGFIPGGKRDDAAFLLMILLGFVSLLILVYWIASVVCGFRFRLFPKRRLASRELRYDNVQIVNAVTGNVIEGHDAVKSLLENEKRMLEAHGSSIIFEVFRIQAALDSTKELQSEKITEIKVNGGFVSGTDTVAAVKTKVRLLLEEKARLQQVRDTQRGLSIDRTDGITFMFSGNPMKDSTLFYADNFIMLPAWVQVLLHDGELGKVAARTDNLSPQALRDNLMQMASRNEFDALALLCSSQKESILQHFPDWINMPKEIAKDSLAALNYENGLLAIATVFQAMGDDRLMSLVRPDEKTLLNRLIRAANEPDSHELSALCYISQADIHKHFATWKAWLRGVMDDPLVTTRYTETLGRVAECFASVGDNRLMTILVGESQGENLIETWPQELNQAQASLSASKPELAIQTLHNALNKRKHLQHGSAVASYLPPTYGMLGVAYLKIGSLNKSIKYLQKAVDTHRAYGNTKEAELYARDLKTVMEARDKGSRL